MTSSISSDSSKSSVIITNNTTTNNQCNKPLPHSQSQPSIASHTMTSHIPSIPSSGIPPMPLFNTTHAPVQINGIQYVLHPSTVPVIVVPNINLMNITNNPLSASNAATPNALHKAPNDKIKQILEKKRNGKDPLTEHEIKILNAAVQSARQQFLCWYQQQALRQQLVFNNNIITNPAQLQQLRALQQIQQLPIAQQQQILQQQLVQTQLQSAMNNNLWMNHANNGRIAPAAYPFNNSTFSANKSYINTYGTEWKTYFALPDTEEFDKLFYNESEEHDVEDHIVSIFGSDAQPDDNTDHICFAVALEGLGTFEFGRYHEQKTELIDTYTKTETTKQKQESLYQLLGVKDIANECCSWLICDLMRSQSKLKSESTESNDKCQVIMTNVINTTQCKANDGISKQQMDAIIDQITYNPVIPHSILHSTIYDIYCSDNQLVEISHVDISRVNINMNIPTCDTSASHNIEYNKDTILNELEITTLEFYNLCIFMQEHFDPTNDGETLKHKYLDGDKFYKNLQKLRDNPQYFKIPALSLSPPVDRKLFGTKMNDKHKHKHNKNINCNVTNHVIHINNVTINTQPTTNPWPSMLYSNTPNVNLSIPTYNHMPFVNPMHSNSNIITPPIIYNIPNPYMNPPHNLVNTRLFTMPTNYQPQAQSQSQRKQMKIPNPTSWNVGGV